MLYLLLYPLHHDYGFLNLFRYTSFRIVIIFFFRPISITFCVLCPI